MRRKGESGFTLVEVTIILLVLVVLANILLPVINNFVNRARYVRVKEDVGALASVIALFMEDNAGWFMQDAIGGTVRKPGDRKHGNTVALLIGDGDTAMLASSVAGDPIWEDPYNGQDIDFFSFHLVQNTPGGQVGNRYRNPSDITFAYPHSNKHEINFERASDGGFNAKFSWRGAYITGPIDPDPWGNRYMANVLFLHPQPTNSFAASCTSCSTFSTFEYERLDVFVLSSGPDEETDTLFAQDGAVAGDDDYMAIVSGNAT